MQFEKTMTRHGAPLYVLPMPGVMSVATGVLVYAGTRDEKWPEEAGLAHACEHMVFQGNARLGSSQAISEEIEAEGGVLNAFTASEMTFFHRFVPASAFEVAVRSLASQMESPLFRPEDVTKEMQNVVAEIKRMQDNPAALCRVVFAEVVYGDHPLGRSTGGSLESVTGFVEADFIRWHERLYHPGNYVFLVVGDITTERALAAVDRVSFGERTGERNERIPIADIHQKTTVSVLERDIEQANVCLGVAIGPAASESTSALDLYANMIDGGMSFPLFQEVRDKRGLCYAVSAGVMPWSDRGVFQIYVGTDMNRLAEALACIKNVVWENRESRTLFDAAKKLLIGRTALKFGSPHAILEEAAVKTVVSGAPKSPSEIIDRIRAITFSDVTEAVNRYLRPDNFSYAYVVPKGTGTKIT